MSMCRIRQAFTLVELLVAIAIIAVLAALIFPVFQAAIHRSKVSACATNLSQLGHAMAMYAEDNGDHIPPYFLAPNHYLRDGTPLFADQNLFKAALARYGAVDAQFYCPLDGDAHKVVTHGRDTVDHTNLSFIYSPAVMKYSEYGDGILKLSLSRVDRPAESVYLADDGWSGGRDWESTTHGTWVNCLFFDGHVKERDTHGLACYFPGQQKGCPE